MSEAMKGVLDELLSDGAVARVALMERSPFMPEPILAYLERNGTTLLFAAAIPSATARAGPSCRSGLLSLTISGLRRNGRSA
jgi:hypothetical protein